MSPDHHSLPQNRTPRPLVRLGRVCFVVAALLLSLAGANSAHATSTPITLGAAANYGLLTGTGEATTINGAFKLTGNLGLATGYKVTISGTNSQTGTTYYDGSGSGGTWTNNGTYTTAGSVNQSMTSAVSAALAASTNAENLAATTAMANQGASITSSITINAVTNLSENVLDLNSVNLTNGSITFNDNGYTGAKYIVNVSGGFSLSNVNFTLSGGASASDIIFNIEGTNQTVSITGGGKIDGNVSIGGGGTLTGALIAGVNNAGKSYTVTEANSGYNITQFAYVPRANVPEPSTIALLGGGMVALAAVRRRKRPRA